MSAKVGNSKNKINIKLNKCAVKNMLLYFMRLEMNISEFICIERRHHHPLPPVPIAIGRDTLRIGMSRMA